MPKESVTAQLGRSSTLLQVIQQNDQLRTALQRVGYNATELMHGQNLYDRALAATTELRIARSDQRAATAIAQAAQRELEAQIGALAQLARTLYDNDRVMMTALGLRRRRRPMRDDAPEADPPEADEPTPSGQQRPAASRSLRTLLDQGDVLYNNILDHPDRVATFDQAGYSRERLERGRDLVDQVSNAESMQRRRIAETRTAVEAQRVALKALDAWVRRLLGVARATLRDQPELLALLRG